LRPNAVPITFKIGPPQTKKLKRNDINIYYALTGPSKHTHCSCHDELIGNKKLLGYVKDEIKTCRNKLKMRETPSENK